MQSLNILKDINKRQSDEICRLTSTFVPSFEPIEKEAAEEKIDSNMLEKEISDLKLKLVDV
jgi:SMC interacting uncharacterized protein involved in chromosome segregation